MELGEMMRAYLAKELHGDELEKAKARIQASPALRAIVAAETLEEEGILEPLPGLDPYLIMRYVANDANSEEVDTVDQTIDKERQESGQSQTFDEIQLLRELNQKA